MNKIKLGLIGYGTVGSGVVKFLHEKKNYIREKFNTEFEIRMICDRNIKRKKPVRYTGKARFTTSWQKVVESPDTDVVIELIGGLHPAKEIVLDALKKGKQVVTANKALISTYGKLLFQEAHKRNRNVYFESSVMAGVPAIKSLSEGLAGNKFNALYGIINGTCNYILSEMTERSYAFDRAVTEAQKNGFAESDPTLDINGMDSAHKLAILVYLAFGKFLDVKEIHTEGITHISHDDIAYAEHLNLAIKLLAIAKKTEGGVEAHVHPTLISKDHPLAWIDGVTNALFIEADPLGEVLLSGDGAGSMAAASGVVSDLINLTSREGSEASSMLGNLHRENKGLKLRQMDKVTTRFYIRFMASDKPGVLSKISGILGRHGIGINSVTQRAHNRGAVVPVIMLTDFTPEKQMRLALNEIYRRGIVKNKPVAIRMENL